MLSFLRTNLLWSEGLVILLVIAGLAVVSFMIYRPLFYVVLGFFLFALWFFRSPERVCQQCINDPSVLVCPADGKVVDIKLDENNGFEGYPQRVSIFLSIFDAHVNWAPMAGVVKEVVYRPGEFKVAFLPKASELNERNDLLISRPDGRTILVRQIAGTIARRICCWVKEGQQIARGQKYGMIRFGSRVDIFLPQDVELSVGLGQRVYGGQTVLGRWT